MKLPAWLRRPWLHFLALGALLFWLQGQLFPTPKPVVGPLSEERIAALQEQWLATVGRPPAADQLQRMKVSELDRDMLFQRGLELELHLYDPVVHQRLLRNMHFLGLAEDRSDSELVTEALAMRLHLGDEVVKRRLIQVMEQLLLAGNPPAQATEDALQAEFDSRREELREPVRYSISHVYLNRERRDEAAALAAALRDGAVSPEQAHSSSSPFLSGYEFQHQSPEQLARHFGAAFVMNFEQAAPQAGTWVGPVQSTFGLHMVYVRAIEPERDLALEEVREQLLRDLDSRARDQALADSIATLREQYEVIL